MATQAIAPSPDVKSLAGEILTAWTGGQNQTLQAKLVRVSGLTRNMDSLNYFEQERLEVLQSIAELLQSKPDLPSSDSASVRLLEHLAQR